MRPDRRFGFGTAWRWQAVAVAWLALIASGSRAVGQGWKAEPIDPKGHTGDVVAVATFGQTLLATAGSDGLAKVWDLVDPNQLSTRLAHRVDLVGHDGKVLAVAVSPNGKLVATAGADGTVRLWDSARGTPLVTLRGHSGAVEALAFAPDGKTVASGGLDTSIQLWDVQTKQVTRTIQGHEQGVRGLAFGPDGKSLASASRDRSIKLWNVPEGTERSTLGKHDAPAWCVAFAPDGETVASGGLDKTVRLWKVDDPALQPVQKVATVGPSPTGGPADQVRERVTAALDQVRAEVPDVLVVQQPQPPAPGGSIGAMLQLVAQGQGQPRSNQVQAWQVGADVASVAFTPDGHYVAAAVSDLTSSRTVPGSVAFFALPSRQPNQPRPPTTLRATIRGHLGPIRGLAFARDGRTVATVGDDASVRVWGASIGEPMAASIGRSQPEAIEERVMAHLDPVEALAITPDGRRVATASPSAGVSLWDATTRTLIGRLQIGRAHV